MHSLFISEYFIGRCFREKKEVMYVIMCAVIMFVNFVEVRHYMVSKCCSEIHAMMWYFHIINQAND